MPTANNILVEGSDETVVGVTQGGHFHTAQTFDKVLVCVRTPIHDGSGGMQLENAPIGGVQLRNGSGNHMMFLGGVGNNAPYSGRGFSLYGGETIFMPVTNLNAVSVMATVSGEHIECMGFLDGHDTVLSTSGMFIAPNVSGPGILSVSPTSGISGVQTNADIFVIFNKCIDPLTVDTSSFVVRVSGSSTAISGIVSADITNCAKFYFTPYSGLIATSTMYRATVGNSITDLVGNPQAPPGSGVWHWTTLSTTPPVDTTRPMVSGVNPTSGTMNVGVDVMPQMLFSEQMQSGSINSSNIAVLLSGVPITANVSLGADLRTATIDPTPGGPLGNNKAYYMTVFSGGVKDIAGNAISGTYQFPFFTEDGNVNLVYNVVSDGNIHQLNEGRFRIGTKVLAGGSPDYAGSILVKMRFRLRKNDHLDHLISGGTSGLVAQIRKNSDDSVIQFTRPFTPFLNPQGDLTTSHQDFDFYNSDNLYPLAVDDRIEVQWLSGSSISGDVRVQLITLNANNGVIYSRREGATYSGSNYVQSSGRDVAGMWWAR